MARGKKKKKLQEEVANSIDNGVLKTNGLESSAEVISNGFNESEWSTKPSCDKSSPRAVHSLKKYQIVGQRLIDNFGGRALVGDEMGMGKSAMCITWVDIRRLYPCLIVCQASMKMEFQKEIKKWLHDVMVVILEGKKPNKIDTLSKLFIIVNYDLISSWQNEIANIGLKCIIFDESHTLGNHESKKAKAAKSLCKGVSNILFLSGTPFKNKETELFLALNILKPEVFPNYESLERDVEDGCFHSKLKKHCLIRRCKEKYLSGLSKKIRTVASVKISNFQEYKFAEDDFVNWIRRQDLKDKKIKIHAFSKIEQLKQLALKGKMKFIKKYIRTHVENRTKLIVFFTHSDPLYEIESNFPDISVRVNGASTMSKRHIAIEEFMTNPQKLLFLGNIRSAGTGLTLVSANKVLMAEMPWTSVDCDQCEDRAHRIGQTSKKVNAHYIIAMDTVEERIATIIDKKRKLIKKAIDDKRLEKNEILMELLYSYKSGNHENNKFYGVDKFKPSDCSRVLNWIAVDGVTEKQMYKQCPRCETINELKAGRCLYCGWSN